MHDNLRLSLQQKTIATLWLTQLQFVNVKSIFVAVLAFFQDTKWKKNPLTHFQNLFAEHKLNKWKSLGIRLDLVTLKSCAFQNGFCEIILRIFRDDKFQRNFICWNSHFVKTEINANRTLANSFAAHNLLNKTTQNSQQH